MKKIQYICIFVVLLFLYSCDSGNTPEDNFALDYSDVQLFYSALSKAENAQNIGKYMYEEYVQKASPGLKDGYAVIRKEDMFPVKNGVIDYSVYGKKIKTLLPYFKKNKDVFLNAKPLSWLQVDYFRKKMCDFLEATLCAQFLGTPKGVYYTISGAMNMGGTAFTKGVFIDISMQKRDTIDYTVLPSTIQQFAAFFNESNTITNEHFVVHEFFHTFQLIAKESPSHQHRPSMLETTINEGGAEFFAYRVSPDLTALPSRVAQKAYMDNNKGKYTEFLNDLNTLKTVTKAEDYRKITLKWFFNLGSPAVTAKQYPVDLGYYIGSQVVDTFYNEEIAASKKKEAVLMQIIKQEIPESRVQTILTTLAGS